MQLNSNGQAVVNVPWTDTTNVILNNFNQFEYYPVDEDPTSQNRIRVMNCSYKLDLLFDTYAIGLKSDGIVAYIKDIPCGMKAFIPLLELVKNNFFVPLSLAKVDNNVFWRNSNLDSVDDSAVKAVLDTLVHEIVVHSEIGRYYLTVPYPVIFVGGNQSNNIIPPPTGALFLNASIIDDGYIAVNLQGKIVNFTLNKWYSSLLGFVIHHEF